MTESELLRKQADMIDMAAYAGMDDWRWLVRVTNTLGDRVNLVNRGYMFSEEAEPEFAIAILNGKPLFAGDEVFAIRYVLSTSPRRLLAKGIYNGRPSDIEMTDGGIFELADLSWSKPKKTVTIELLVEDAAEMTQTTCSPIQPAWVGRVADACKAALSQQKD